MKWTVGLLLLLISAGVAVGFTLALLWQHDANHNFVSVDAIILSTEIRAHSGKSTTYSPEATYVYTFAGKQYQSTRVTAFSQNAGNSWARNILSQIDHKAGNPEAGGWRSTAYVNPSNPQEAILVRTYAFLPYGFAMMGTFGTFFTLGYLTGIIGGGRTKMAALALDDSGWQLLLPKHNLQQQFRNSLIILLVSIPATTPLPAHWSFVAGQRDIIGTIAWGLSATVILISATIAFRRWNISRHMSDVRLRMRPVPPTRGQPLALEAEADALSPLNLREMTATLVCTQHYKERTGNKTTYGTRKHLEKKILLAPASQIAAGDVLTGNGELLLTDCPPSSDLTVKLYPYYTWELTLTAKLEGMVDYKALFPLEVD